MMKFFYCIVFAIIICLQSVKGQVFVGVKGGLNYVNNDTNYDNGNPGGFSVDFNYRLAYHFGGFATFPLTDILKVRSELLLSQKGNTSQLRNSSIDLRLFYINLPVLLQFLIEDKVGIEVGPDFGYLISAKTKGSQLDGTNLKYLYENIDIGVIFGGRYFVSDVLSIGLHYSHGISSTHEILDFDENAFLLGEASFKNRSCQLSVSYRLN